MIGWKQSQEAIEGFFLDDRKRVLFVHGPCGTGKTFLTKTFAKKHGMAMVKLTDPTAQVAAYYDSVRAQCVLAVDDLPSALAFFEDLAPALRGMAMKNRPPRSKFFFSATSADTFYQLVRKWPFLGDKKYAVVTRTFKPFPSAIKTVLRPSREAWRIAQLCDGDVRKAKLMDALQVGGPKTRQYDALETAEMLLGRRPGHPEDNHCDGAALAWAFDNYFIERPFSGVVEFAERFSTLDACRATLPALRAPQPPPPQHRTLPQMKRRVRARPRVDLRRLGVKFHAASLFGAPLHVVRTYVCYVHRCIFQPLSSDYARLIAWGQQHDFTEKDRRLMEAAFDVDA